MQRKQWIISPLLVSLEELSGYGGEETSVTIKGKTQTSLRLTDTFSDSMRCFLCPSVVS